jgi:hypothetical protein
MDQITVTFLRLAPNTILVDDATMIYDQHVYKAVSEISPSDPYWPVIPPITGGSNIISNGYVATHVQYPMQYQGSWHPMQNQGSWYIRDIRLDSWDAPSSDSLDTHAKRAAARQGALQWLADQALNDRTLKVIIPDLPGYEPEMSASTICSEIVAAYKIMAQGELGSNYSYFDSIMSQLNIMNNNQLSTSRSAQLDFTTWARTVRSTPIGMDQQSSDQSIHTCFGYVEVGGDRFWGRMTGASISRCSVDFELYQRNQGSATLVYDIAAMMRREYTSSGINLTCTISSGILENRWPFTQVTVAVAAMSPYTDRGYILCGEISGVRLVIGAVPVSGPAYKPAKLPIKSYVPAKPSTSLVTVSQASTGYVEGIAQRFTVALSPGDAGVLVPSIMIDNVAFDSQTNDLTFTIRVADLDGFPLDVVSVSDATAAVMVAIGEGSTLSDGDYNVAAVKCRLRVPLTSPRDEDMHIVRLRISTTAS